MEAINQRLLKRRAFLKAGCVFTGLIWIPKTIAQVPMMKNPAYLATLKGAPAAGGGPDVWYDVETAVNTDTTGSFVGTNYISAVVTVGVGGTATMLKLKVSNSDTNPHDLKLALYSNAGAKLSSGTATVADTDDNVYKEVTLSPSVAVSATTYILAAMGDGIGIDYHYKNGVGAMDDWEAKVYADFPYDPIGAPTFDDLARNLAISIYVD